MLKAEASNDSFFEAFGLSIDKSEDNAICCNTIPRQGSGIRMNEQGQEEPKPCTLALEVASFITFLHNLNPKIKLQLVIGANDCDREEE